MTERKPLRRASPAQAFSVTLMSSGMPDRRFSSTVERPRGQLITMSALRSQGGAGWPAAAAHHDRQIRQAYRCMTMRAGGVPRPPWILELDPHGHFARPGGSGPGDAADRRRRADAGARIVVVHVIHHVGGGELQQQ